MDCHCVLWCCLKPHRTNKLRLFYIPSATDRSRHLTRAISLKAIRPTSNMSLDVDSILRRIGQFGPSQIRILVMFLFIFLPITYQSLIMVFAAYEPPWMCANNSVTCLESNSSSAQSAVYSTATRPIDLYERRCSLNRSDWKFADYNLYEGPHQTIVDQVRKGIS